MPPVGSDAPFVDDFDFADRLTAGRGGTQAVPARRQRADVDLRGGRCGAGHFVGREHPARPSSRAQTPARARRPQRGAAGGTGTCARGAVPRMRSRACACACPPPETIKPPMPVVAGSSAGPAADRVRRAGPGAGTGGPCSCPAAGRPPASEAPPPAAVPGGTAVYIPPPVYSPRRSTTRRRCGSRRGDPWQPPSAAADADRWPPTHVAHRGAAAAAVAGSQQIPRGDRQGSGSPRRLAGSARGGSEGHGGGGGGGQGSNCFLIFCR